MENTLLVFKFYEKLQKMLTKIIKTSCAAYGEIISTLNWCMVYFFFCKKKCQNFLCIQKFKFLSENHCYIMENTDNNESEANEREN